MRTFLQPGVATNAVAAPNSAGTFVQFVNATANPTVTTAVHNPNDYTGATSTPRLAVGRNTTGAIVNPPAPTAATFDTLYTLNYDATGLTAQAQHADVGSTWGIAYDPATGTIFSAAMIKRHSGMGPGGPDAIYATGPSVPAAWATPFTAVDTDGGAIGSNAARGLGADTAPSDDDASLHAGRRAELG